MPDADTAALAGDTPSSRASRVVLDSPDGS
jgi:hypothetical protein